MRQKAGQRSRWALGSCLLFLLLAWGCGRTTVGPVTPPKMEPPAPESSMPAETTAEPAAMEEQAKASDNAEGEPGVNTEGEVAVAEPEDVSPEQEDAEVSPPGEQLAEADAQDSASSEDDVDAAQETPDESSVPAERIMLLTESGPLLLDLHITIEGRPYREAFEQTLDDVLKLADSDEDGVVTWEEIMSHPRFRDGQFGNPATSTYQAQQDMIRLYDSTTNGRVDPDELVRYLTSNQGTAQPITLVTSNSQRSYNRDRSPLREWLDRNQDLVLDADEIAAAPRRLRLRDADDDEILTTEDFAPAGSTDPNMMPRRRRKIIGPPKAGWLIRKDESWNEMLAGWETLYSLGSPVQRGDLMLGEELFVALNIDQDEVLSAYELEMLTEVDPHFQLNVDLGQEGDAAAVELVALNMPIEQTKAVVQHQPNRLTVHLESATLDIFASDTIGYQRFDEQAANVIQQADGDKNSYLSEDEFEAIQPIVNVEFSAADLDGNEMVFADEIVTLFKQRNLAARSQLRVKADDQVDALWPSVDRNADGRIDSREMATASESLRALDGDEDGAVQLHELRGSLMIGLVRGANGPGVPESQAFRVPTVVRPQSESSPRWFVSMDRNQDQGISWREFLGSREQFDVLDRDEDGFLELEESFAAEAGEAE